MYCHPFLDPARSLLLPLPGWIVRVMESTLLESNGPFGFGSIPASTKEAHIAGETFRCFDGPTVPILPTEATVGIPSCLFLELETEASWAAWANAACSCIIDGSL